MHGSLGVHRHIAYTSNYIIIINVLVVGHFSWLFKSKLMRYAFSRSNAGKAAAYIRRVTLDLVRARRESGQAEKVMIKVRAVGPGTV